jgi:hypothetical protein
MPNWSSTSFIIRGPEDEIKAFFNGVKVVKNESGLNSEIKILEGHLPCPQELFETTSTFALKEIPENWAKMVTDGEWTQEQYDQRVAENAELLKRQEANRAKFGANDWYDWQTSVWGVKWGDCETSFHEEPTPYGYNDLWFVSGWFQTPWGTASEGFRKISEKFPNCAFLFDSDEEAGFFCGIEIMHDGEIPYEEFFAPCDYDKEVDWDDDESIDEHNAWKESQSDSIWEKATEWLQDNGFLKPKVVPVKTFTKTEKTEKKKPHFWKFA